MTEEDDPWMLSRRDADALDELRDELWEWRFHADTPRDYLTVAAFCDAIDCILERTSLACTLQLGCLVRPERLDGISVDAEIGDEGIRLSIMEFIATGQGLSCDHGTIFSTQLGADGSFCTQSVTEWIKKAAAARDNSPELMATITYLEIEG